ncbi:hypothetical protein HX004_11315 [Myroides sp. 1354]|uniref:hypothetical protein n=1 Tax=unclassified Myroides TaxID=2642485 RepID=UPI0025771FE2|nr:MULTISPECIES: hypothetical protein [unclassified Myroides]MDM1045403.1 hypothetical protein [Myroides sp. R163-1]MDM1056360.1 hypothetical protein [Myroides sp. 1354]MDM1069534.1 hypothetical protein [Myroides sp. 1372]
MKKIYSILFGASLLALCGVGVSSCSSSDDDFIDPDFKVPTYFTVTLPDTTFVKKDEFKARLNENGEFHLYIDDLMNGQIFDMKILKFQLGNFPTNLNTIDYSYKIEDTSFEFFNSTDLANPKRNNGIIKITKIDRNEMLVSGNFSSLLLPSPVNQYMKQSFTITGKFENIPYERVGKGASGFVYTNINGEDIRDMDVFSNFTGDVINNQIVINAKSKSMRKRAITISFDKNLPIGSYDYAKVKVQYTSENGVVYVSNEKDADLVGSFFRIDKIENWFATNSKTYSGKFTFKLKSKEGDVITLNFGDYKAKLSMKEVIINPDPGTDPGTDPGIPEL